MDTAAQEGLAAPWRAVPRAATITAVNSPKPPRSANALWTVAAVVATAASALTVGGAFTPYLRVFALSGDDFGIVLRSSAQYVSPAQMLQWFTKGYLGYWDNYPGWAPTGTAFVRPLLNFMVYAQGSLAGVLGDRAFMIADYAAVFATVCLLVVLLRRYTDLAPLPAGVLAAAVGLSPIWYLSLLFPIMGTTALPFCVGALVVLDPGRQGPGWQRLMGCSILLTLAVAIHETSLVAVPICIAVLYGYAPKMPSRRELLWFAIPVAFFGIERVLLDAFQGAAKASITPSNIYALGLGGGLVAPLKHLLVGPLVPYDSMRFLYQRMEGLSAQYAAVWAMAIVANIVVFAAITSGLRGESPRRLKVALVSALAMALFFPLLMNADPRIMGLSFVLALVAAIALNPGRRRLQWLVVAAVLAANIGLFALVLSTEVPGHIRAAKFSSAYADYLRRSIAQSDRKQIILVNDPVGATGARAMLQIAAWPRTDLDFIVVNSYDGACYSNMGLVPNPSLEGAKASSVAILGNRLHVTTRYSDHQILLFGGNTPDYNVSTSGFRYSGIEPTGSAGGTLDASGPVLPGDSLIVGVDPTTGTMLGPLLP